MGGAEENENGCRLFHQHCQSEKQAAEVKRLIRLSIHRSQQQQHPGRYREHEQMRCMCGPSEDRCAGRHDRVTRRRGNSGRNRICHSPAENKKKRARGEIYDEQTEMNSRNRLSEDRHKQSVSRRCPRKLHAVSQLVRRDPLQHELAAVRVLAFVAFEREFEESYANENANADRNCH